MTKQELELKKKELQTELHQVENKLHDFDYEEKKAKYGDKFTCEFCMYNAYHGFSPDGWHNTCGANNCTCCNSNCRKYEPDNDVTLFIKQHIRADSGFLRSIHTNGYGYIDDEEYRGIKYLIGDIFNPYDQSEKMIELLKVCFDTKQKESEDTE